jgi:hypothetical protein
MRSESRIQSLKRDTVLPMKPWPQIKSKNYRQWITWVLKMLRNDEMIVCLRVGFEAWECWCDSAACILGVDVSSVTTNEVRKVSFGFGADEMTQGSYCLQFK